MKALQEIVDYLFSRGRLSSEEMISLAMRGFLIELPQEATSLEESPEEPYQALEAREERRYLTLRKKGRGKPKRKKRTKKASSRPLTGASR